MENVLHNAFDAALYTGLDLMQTFNFLAKKEKSSGRSKKLVMTYIRGKFN